MSKRFILICVGVIVVVIAALVVPSLSAKRKADSVSCGNQMASIGVAALLWAGDHEGIFPPDFLSMSNELVSPKVLMCPGDHSRHPVVSWSGFTPAESSYEIVSTGLKEGDTNRVFVRCKIHGHLGYADGTVFDGVRRRRKIH